MSGDLVIIKCPTNIVGKYLYGQNFFYFHLILKYEVVKQQIKPICILHLKNHNRLVDISLPGSNFPFFKIPFFSFKSFILIVNLKKNNSWKQSY